MSVPDHCLLLLCSRFIESTTLCVALREASRNRLCQFPITNFCSSVSILLSLQLCVWCVGKDVGKDYVSS